MRFVVSFSGGKDSMLAMHRMIKSSHECVAIFTTTNKDIGSWFHDIDLNILKALASSLNVDFVQFALDVNEYSEMFEENLLKLKNEYNIEGVVFGDIDIEDHFRWCQERCENVGLKAIFPLWNEGRKAIVEEFIDLGYRAIIKRVDKNKLPKHFLKRELSYQLLDEFKEYNIDLCGENGEYHTLVYGGGLFNKDISLLFRDIVESENTYVLGVGLDEEQ